MRVVDPEDPDSMRHPEPDDPLDLGIQALRVIVEVERVDVLILLRWVLGVGDGAVGARREPLRVLGNPRMVWGGLEREVEGDLHAEVGNCRDEAVEVVDGAEVWMDGVVTAVLRPDGPR